MKTIFVKPKDVVRKWYVLDAEGVPLGRVAVKAANLARGKQNKKIYYNYSGYPGGMRAETYKAVLEKKPTYPMERAVKGMLPHGALGNKLFANVKIYAGPDHPHAAQNPEKLEI